MFGLSYAEPCAPPLSGFFGLGAATTAAQRRATALAKQQQRRTLAAQKKAARLAGKKVLTSKPNTVSALDASIAKANAAAQASLANVKRLQATAKRTRSKVDYQKALAAAQTAIKNVQTMLPGAPVAQATMRGLMGLGACVPDATGNGVDDQTGQACSLTDPNTGLPQQPIYQQPLNTGLVPGFGTPGYGYGGGYGGGAVPAPQYTGFPYNVYGGSAGGGYSGDRCARRPDLPNCIILQLERNEQQQFQYVFSIMQQMYAQLLQIVQQLMAELQSAQQQPYGQSPYGPYGQTPYGQYGDPNNPYGQQSPYGGYGSPYPGPGGYPGQPYYAGGGGSSVIPPGYGDSGGDMFGPSGQAPGDAGAIFPGPGPMQQGPIAQGPSQPSNIISSDSLPIGAEQGDMWGGGDAASAQVPAYTPAPQAMQPIAVQSGSASQSATTGPNTPQIIVLQQGPGQSAYADTMLPAGPSQDQPSLEPPSGGDSW